MKKSLSVMIIIGALIVGLFHFMDNNTSGKLFNAGKHSGEAQGFNGPIKVEVTTSQDKIENITIIEHGETAVIADPALKQIPEDILKHQSVAVDSVSGATVSSKGIKDAITNALKSAGADIAKISIPVTTPVETTNKVDDSKNKEVSKSETSETKVEETKIEEVKTEEPNKVEDKVETTKKDGTLFIPGTFSGEGFGYNGAIKVDVTTSENKIEDIKVISHDDTKTIAEPAFKSIIEAVLGNQSIAVDAVAGASASSKGIKDAITAALTTAGAKLEDISKPVTAITTPNTEVKDVNTDVVVVGGGGAGLTAAITAKEKGMNVILLEKMPMLGGNTTYSTGGMNAANTKLQKENKIEDSEELFYEDTMKGGQNKNDPALLKVMTDNAKDMVDWLIERGMDLSEVSVSGGASAKRIHRPKGGKAVGPVLVEALKNKAESLDVDIRTNSEVISIIKDGSKVVGVEVKQGDKTYKVNAKAVIMATGGFGSNPDMIADANPAYKGFGTTNSPAITGEGIKMVEKAGGTLVDMPLIQTHPTVVHNDTAMITESVRGEGAILVNRDGKRFINELDTRDVVSKAVLAQKGGSAFLVFDQTVRDNLGVINTYVTKGFAKEAPTLEELGKLIGADEKELSKTINTFNEGVKNKEDKEFGNKTLKLELVKSPFYAIEISPAIHHTMGGVKINTDTEVVDSTGKTIDGLFAAGEITGGIHGANRIGGNAVADIIVFGHIAGNNAATYAKLGAEAYNAQKPKNEDVKVETKIEEVKKEEEKTEKPKKDEDKIDETNRINNLKKQEELKKTLDSSQKNINLSFSEEFTFDKNSDQVKDGYKDHLDAIADYLTKNPNATIRIIGHTDSDGDRSYNKDLSQRRANNIKIYLSSKRVDATRITSIGRGEDKPLVPNKGSANKAKNRRVDIEIKN